jgi:hypothetical protein
MVPKLMDDYDLENCYDEDSQTIALEGEYDIEALEKVVEWLKEKNEWIP